MRALDVTRSTISSSLALWRGTGALRPARHRPDEPLELYDFENCPYCRLVRELLTELDLDVLVKPCPKQGERFRRDVIRRGGKAQFPFLVDPNTGRELYESADIMSYLGETYGRPSRGTTGLGRALRVVTSTLASVSNGTHGVRARPSRAPNRPLELFSFESSPYSRLVRETLCELELPYLLRNTGKGSVKDLGPPVFRDRLWKAPRGTNRNRVALEARTGRVQLPYLIDPNTGIELFESKVIKRYLVDTYAL